MSIRYATVSLLRSSFTSVSPALAAEVTNTAMDEFINMHMDSRLKASQDAGKFLNKQIEGAQIKLEKSELELQAFAKKIGIVSLDPKQNLTMRQLEELNDALAKARSSRIALEARYLQLSSPDSKGNLFRMVENKLIQDLKNSRRPCWPNMSSSAQPLNPAIRGCSSSRPRWMKRNSEYRLKKTPSSTLFGMSTKPPKRPKNIWPSRTEEQKQRAMELEEKATQYKIFAREVETNKIIYQSLLERSKEIEATLGSSVTNIQVVDMARAPLYPFKPRVALNLALGLVLGLVGGVGAAFLLEYFDNTIKNPDEMIDRFGIPVLGLVPYDKTGVDDRKTMALKFFNEPRSPVAEAIRTTMTSVRLSVADDPPKTILVTSILAGAGKVFIIQ